MGEMHEGLCRAHRPGLVMNWLMVRHGYYWQTIMTDCNQYAKGCEEFQRFGPLQKIPLE